MTSKITVEKSTDRLALSASYDHSDRMPDMKAELRTFFDRLDKPNDQFDASSAFDALILYIKNYERILYSTISNIIYARYDTKGFANDTAGTLLSNLDALIRYSENPDNINTKKNALSSNQLEKCVDDARKVVLKIWDHVTLASQQYTMLKQSDEEYDAKFKERIATYKDEMSKEMNAQMITMVSIFTVLAFLVFGSISSLDGIFENLKMPLFKVMGIGLIWGLCVINLVFVFLYCVGKLTKLNFKVNNFPEATIFQHYPIIWWTNLILIALLTITSWAHFIQQNRIGQFIIERVNCNPIYAFWIGTIAITLLFGIAIFILAKKTKYVRKY